MNPVHYSSKSDEWETPQELFDELDKEFNFRLDPCCTPYNKKCKYFYSKERSGLENRWSPFGPVFMNPPYGREIGKWVKKAYEESQKGCTVVCLLPARTDTKWWHDYVMQAVEVRLIKGRLKFGGVKNNAPFPSAIVIFNLNEFPRMHSSYPIFTSVKL
jgi:site-specific DNA-methyltransferase (adenine-specific)